MKSMLSLKVSLDEESESLLNDISPAYFQASASDPLGFELLNNLPNGPSVSEREYLKAVDEVTTNLEETLEVINITLMKRVVQKHDSFVSAVEQIRFLEEAMETTVARAKISRHQLAGALVEVNNGLKIAQNNHRKEELVKALDILMKLQTSRSIVEELAESISDGAFAESLQLSTSLEDIIQCLPADLVICKSLQTYKESIKLDISNQLQIALTASATGFSPELFHRVLEAFIVLDLDAPSIEAEIGKCMANAVEAVTIKVARGLLFTLTGFETNTALQPSQVEELVELLPVGLYLPCLSQTLMLLFDILSTHHEMLCWHDAIREQPPPNIHSLEQWFNMVETSKTALERCKGAMWEKIETYLVAMWQRTVDKTDNFMQALTWTLEMIQIGGLFTATTESNTSELLWMALRAQCEVYFKSVHDGNIEALSSLLEKEQWNALPLSSTAALDIVESLSDPIKNTTPEHSKTFEEYLAAGNPWKRLLLTVDDDDKGVDIENILVASTATDTVEEEAAVVVTNASLKILKWIHEYINLSNILMDMDQSISLAIIDLYELYYVYVFACFGQGTSSSTTTSSSPLQPIPSIVQAELKRITETGVLCRHSHLGFTWDSLSKSRRVTGVLSAVQLKQGLIAADSLISITRVLALSVSQGQALNEAAKALKAYIVLVMVYATLPMTWVTVAITSANYEISEPPSKPSDWTLQLGRQVQLWADGLNDESPALINHEVLKEIWNHAVYHILKHGILPGLVAVKRCTLEGRSAMSLDLQQVTKVLNRDGCMASRETVGNALRLADDYIKAFYLPLLELPEWARMHPVYTYTEVLSLAYCISESSMQDKAAMKMLLSRVELELRTTSAAPVVANGTHNT